MKEFKDFELFNKEAELLLDKYSSILSDKIETEQVSFIRENIDKELLISYVFISDLTGSIQILLNSNTKVLKFSMDNYLKNRIMHPEVTVND